MQNTKDKDTRKQITYKVITLMNRIEARDSRKMYWEKILLA